MMFAWSSGSVFSIRSTSNTLCAFDDYVGSHPHYHAVFTLQPLDPTSSDPTYTAHSLSEVLHAHLRAAPSWADPSWCSELPGALPPRVRTPEGVRHFLTVSYPEMRGGYSDFRTAPLLDATGNDLRYFPCFHCAYVAGRDIVANVPTVGGLPPEFRVHTALANHTSVTTWLPLPPEVTGQASIPGSSTLKNVLADSLHASSCSRCGRGGHNSRTCERPAKAHDKLGIEIEGRWLNLRDARARASAMSVTGCGDGSVGSSSHSAASPYEFQTVPGSLVKSLEQLVALYPDETDHTCGMHVHISFLSHMDISLLCSMEFFSYFKQRWEAWGIRMNISGRTGDRKGEFWKRLDGDNDYCQVNSHVPASPTSMDRYHQLNFSSWNEHRTVECRLLPMFRSTSLAVLAVEELVDIIETFLAEPEVHGLALDSAVNLDPPSIEPVVANHDIGHEDTIPFVPDTLVLDLPVADIPPCEEGTIRTYRGLVMSGVSLFNILVNNNIDLREAS